MKREFYQLATKLILAQMRRYKTQLSNSHNISRSFLDLVCRLTKYPAPPALQDAQSMFQQIYGATENAFSKDLPPLRALHSSCPDLLLTQTLPVTLTRTHLTANRPPPLTQSQLWTRIALNLIHNFHTKDLLPRILILH